jgi:hypothetical protein
MSSLWRGYARALAVLFLPFVLSACGSTATPDASAQASIATEVGRQVQATLAASKPGGQPTVAATAQSGQRPVPPTPTPTPALNFTNVQIFQAEAGHYSNQPLKGTWQAVWEMRTPNAWATYFYAYPQFLTPNGSVVYEPREGGGAASYCVTPNSAYVGASVHSDWMAPSNAGTVASAKVAVTGMPWQPGATYPKDWGLVQIESPALVRDPDGSLRPEGRIVNRGGLSIQTNWKGSVAVFVGYDSANKVVGWAAANFAGPNNGPLAPGQEAKFSSTWFAARSGEIATVKTSVYHGNCMPGGR